MNIKKEYNVDDIVWIHGIDSSNKLTQGRVISSIDLSQQGYENIQYVIEIPTHIEPLLEIRSWHTISQDSKGPVGSLRTIKDNLSNNNRKMRQMGYVASDDIDDDPTPDQIMAALEKSAGSMTHQPLNLKETKPKPRFYRKRKK